MLVRFLVDYRGVLTGEQYFTADTEAEIADGAARKLIADERAEAVDETPEPDDSPAPAKRRRARKPKGD